MQSDERDRAEALALLREFAERLLPGTLRRIAAWKRIGRRELRDLTDDLGQELAVDCMLHARAIVALPVSQRHVRWMRFAERWIYRHHLRPRLPAIVPERTPATGTAVDGTAAELPELPLEFVRLANGRCNLSASAVRDGRPRASLRSEVERLVAQLGCDADYDAFWRARLAEAMTGLAADLLRQRGAVHLLPGARARPDPERRLWRIRALGRRFHVRLATIGVRRIVRRWTLAEALDGDDVPRRILCDAVDVWPRSPVAWPWLAEACLAVGDLRSALAAVRAHRALPARERGRTVLLRARVLEQRGRWPAACALLRRAARRWPHEARLRRALAAVTC